MATCIGINLNDPNPWTTMQNSNAISISATFVLLYVASFSVPVVVISYSIRKNPAYIIYEI